MGAIEVLKPGQLSLLHDFGRFGLSQLGITQGGPVDDYAYSWANYLLGNSTNSTALEITLGQAAFKILSHCNLAICGGDLQAKLDGQPICNWSRFSAKKGQTLTFGLPRNGLRAYLAVEGGFDAPTHYGSNSTVPKDLLGGLHQDGQSLKASDIIGFSQRQTANVRSKKVTFRFTPDYNLPLRLRVIESYQHSHFSEDFKTQFFSQEFIVDQSSNRMGYRLKGVDLNPPNESLISEGIALGSIQLPPDGNPIILLNDRQTIGGYPKLGCVARIDLPRLAQAKPGQAVHFVLGDREGLQQVWCKWARFFGY
ncbi:biotin-dependent carboxyltransferase family protein [Vibrio sp. SCSIO 43136]|uniref:5-oxoprolinase subunit C family protein n=1 Tax=Vibrio sp. SCSIO 43136 TaxID=2819101 RepID=UPI0020757287|nr:biotin-dependent carboxyltransferase family protein [Vibrio sp. SCSIO 43136]USD68217.1 biotin-dependent carboxyltransferase [Vibrio sp. SCSIO 43136]